MGWFLLGWWGKVFVHLLFSETSHKKQIPQIDFSITIMG